MYGTSLRVVVVDLDSPQAISWATQHLPSTPMRTITGGGGEHWYYLYPKDVVVIRNKAKIKCDGTTLALDIRGDGGQAVAPGSIHGFGTVYREAEPWTPELVASIPELPVDALAADKDEQESAKARAKRPAPRSRPLTLGTTPYGAKALAEECDTASRAQDGERNNTLNTAAFKIATLVAGNEVEEDEAREAFLAAAACAGVEEREARSTINSAFRGGKEKPRSAPPPHALPGGPGLDVSDDLGGADGAAEDAVPRTSNAAWRKKLLVNDRGEPKANLFNLLHVLENWDVVAGLFAYDAFQALVVLRKRPPWEPTKSGRTYPSALTDHDVRRLTAIMAKSAHVDAPHNLVGQATYTHAARHTFDSLCDHLNGLPKWDGTQRLSSWLTTHMGAEDKPITRAMGRAWMISAIARAFLPGCQADHVLVMEGLQGLGKSTTLRVLAGGADWFLDDSADIHSKDAKILMQGKWIIEQSELESFTRADVATVRRFIATRVDKFRAPYATTSVSYPRRCVFAATTNSERYLKDDEGARRFWCVKCKPVVNGAEVDHVGLARDRDQLWAEALVAFRAGEPWHLTGDVQRAAAVEAEERRQQDPWEALLGERLKDKSSTTTAECLVLLNVGAERQDRSHEMRAARVIRLLGFTEKRRRDGNTWIYSRPDAAGGASPPVWLTRRAPGAA